jgi:hypothetical protein
MKYTLAIPREQIFFLPGSLSERAQDGPELGNGRLFSAEGSCSFCLSEYNKCSVGLRNRLALA